MRSSSEIKAYYIFPILSPVQGSEHVAPIRIEIGTVSVLDLDCRLYFRIKPVDSSREDQNPYNILVVFHALGSKPKDLPHSEDQHKN